LKIKSIDLACGNCGYGEFVEEMKNRMGELR